MNRITYLTLLAFVFTLVSTAQSVKISAIVQGDCPSGGTSPDVIQLYVDGTVDVTNLNIQFQFSFSEHWNLNESIGTGVYTDTYIYLVNSAVAFEREFPEIGSPQNTTVGTVLFTVDGGEKIRLVDSSNENEVLDIYGHNNVNGQGESWSFLHSFAKRDMTAVPNGTFTESEWTIEPAQTLQQRGVCWEQTPLNNMVEIQGSEDTLSLGIEKETQEVSLFPNPTRGMMTITNTDNVHSYEVFNIVGQKITANILNTNNTINLTSQRNGVYFVKFDTGTTLRVIKK